MTKSILDLVQGNEEQKDTASVATNNTAPTGSVLGLLDAPAPEVKEEESSSILDMFGSEDGESKPWEVHATELHNDAVDLGQAAGGFLSEVGEGIRNHLDPQRVASRRRNETFNTAGEVLDNSVASYPARAQSRVGGVFSFLGADDNIDSFEDVKKEYDEVMADENASLLSKAWVFNKMYSPSMGVRAVLDKADELRAKALEEVTIKKGKNVDPEETEVTLKDIFTDAGEQLSKEGQEKIDELSPKNPSMTDEALFAAPTSLIDMALGGGLLKLHKMLSAKSLTATQGTAVYTEEYANKLAETGDSKLAGAHAAFSMGVEAMGELPANMQLIDKMLGGDKFVDAVKKFIAYDMAGEQFAELTQLASDIVNSKEGEKRSAAENFEIWYENAPRVAGVTALATGMSAGTVSSVTGGYVKLAEAYDNYKVNRAYDLYSTQKRVKEVQDAAMVRAKYKLMESQEELMRAKMEDAQSLDEILEDLDQMASQYEEMSDLSYMSAPFQNLNPDNNIFGILTSSTLKNDVDIQDEAGNVVSYEEAAQAEGTVYWGQANKMSSFGKRAEANIREVESIKQSIEQAELLGENHRLPALQQRLAAAQELAEKNVKRNYISNWLKTDGLNFMRELVKEFGYTHPIVLHDNAQARSPKSTRALGHMSPSKEKLTELMMNAAAYEDQVTLNADYTVDTFKTGLLTEVLAHEMGHVMAYDLLRKSPEVVKQAVVASYNKYRQDMWKLYSEGNGTALDVMRGTFGSATVMDTKRRSQQSLKNFTANARIKDWQHRNKSGQGSFFNYVMSFDEWFAHQMERAAHGDRLVNKVTQNHILRTNAYMKNWNKKLKKMYPPAPAFSKMLQYFNKNAQKHSEEIATNIELNEVGNSVEEIDAPPVQETVGGVVEMALPEDDIVSPIINPKAHLDTYNGFLKQVMTLTQLANENSHIAELQTYLRNTEKWWAEKSKWNTMAIETVEAWQSLGKDKADRVAKFAIAVTLESDNLGRRLTDEELADLNQQKKFQLDGEAFAIWQQIDNDFRNALGFDMQNPDGLYLALLNDIKRVHADNPEVALAKIQELDKDMKNLADRNFFPLSRFGRLAITIKADQDMVFDGKAYNKGETIAFETFEDTKAQEKSLKEYKKMLKGKPVGYVLKPLDDLQFQFSAMPPNLVNSLRKHLELSPEQASALEDIVLEQTTASRFKKHLLERSGTPGFSQDGMRGYAGYMMSFANSVARMLHAPEMQAQIDQLENTLGAIGRQEGKTEKELLQETQKRDAIVRYMKEHFQYAMNPGNELANLRSLAFLFYMGFMPAAAAVNLTQIPLATIPYLSSRKELGGSKLATGLQATGFVTKATTDIMNIFKGKESKFSNEENLLFKELTERGIIDESQAQELAGLAEGSTLNRYLPDGYGVGGLKSQASSRAIRNASYAGAFLFHHAEKLNRRVTALAAYRLGKKAGLTHEQAVNEAHRAVRETQFEYARWNRPQIMRGKKSIIFMFKMYLENMLYFMARGNGGRKAILLFFLINGLQGGPGAEDMMDIYDFLSNKWNKYFGKQGARSAVREDLRAIAQGLNLDPNMVMHGVGSRYGLGLLHMGEFAGINVPNIDITSRTSMGRVIPGLQPLLGTEAQGGDAAAEAAGAIIAVPVGMYKAMTSENPDRWKEWEKTFPATARYISQTARFIARGEETRYDGSTLKPYNVSDPLDVAELVFHSMGFRSEELARLKERDWAAHQQIQFFNARKSQLLRQLATATLAKDREAIADANKAVISYNKTIPHPSLSITGKARYSAVQRMAKNRKLNEQGIAIQRQYRPVQKSLLELFPIEDEPAR